jgi:hypothetical protein
MRHQHLQRLIAPLSTSDLAQTPQARQAQWSLDSTGTNAFLPRLRVVLRRSVMAAAAVAAVAGVDRDGGVGDGCWVGDVNGRAR